ncbi:hypothetical protein ACUNWD_15115 [Sunxiuqinia sp. A32]|uniref:hypothetical protein n=1 Tax=Sunxiuqinia sp. A32 TaxID=3461496 RepID=UPI0040467CE9
METILKKIKTHFPKSAPYDEVLEHYYQRMLNEYGLEKEKSIAAVSLCPDELNNVVIERVRDYFGHVFMLGGLAGYPFTGETGFNAFGDHIPDDGTAFIFFGPHIGIGENKLGYVHRVGQKRETLSCGAAFGAYQALLAGKTKPFDELPHDYQQARIQQMVAPKIDQMPKEDFEIALLDLLFDESHDFIVRHSNRIKEQFKSEKIILMGAFVLNTPLSMPDYLQVKYFEKL